MGDDAVEHSPGGSWIVHHADDSDGPSDAWQPGDFHDDLGDALQRAFAAEPVVLHAILDDLHHIDVWIVPPNDRRPYQTLVTAGMSDRPMTVPTGYGRAHAELTLSLPASWTLTTAAMESERAYWPVRLLVNLARFPQRYATFLDETHTVPNGDLPEPYAMNTRMVCALIGPSPFGGTELGDVHRRDGPLVRFLSVIPIYRDEMEFKLRHGAAALFERLKRAGINDVLNAKRATVCRRKRFGIL